MHIENISAKAREVFWAYLHKHGRRCFFSGVSLEIDDDTSPWYFIKQLANFYRKGSPVRKRKLVYWSRGRTN